VDGPAQWFLRFLVKQGQTEALGRLPGSRGEKLGRRCKRGND
jgi:hypothetical protein